jgi:hypothetical protein
MPRIDDYQFGRIVIDGRTYTSDVIIYPDRVDASWWRQTGHRLVPEDLPDVLNDPPEVLVVGEGKPGLMSVPSAARRRFEDAGMEVIIEPTTQAWQTYNRLRLEKRTVAALHLTC